MNYLRQVTIPLLLMLSGCATTTLTQWTDTQLSPYLAKELGQHPRFKNQPLLLVDMRGENVQADIDKLTTDIRDQVFNQLVQTPGVNLSWHPSAAPWQHHTRLAELQCHKQPKHRYFIGFDIKPVEQRFQLSVKALDTEQGHWVSGFGKTWTGALTRKQQQALQQSRPDEFLRGLRPLPFDAQQTDLLAAYLARNFSCLLQQSNYQRLVIYPQIKAKQSDLVKRTMRLIGNYLSRFHEVSMSDSASTATLILNLELHRINAPLYQMWLTVKNSSSQQYASGLDTDVYVNIQQAPIAAPAIPESATQPPVVHTDLSLAVGKPVQLFTKLDVITPIGEPFCATSTPWIMGEYLVNTAYPVQHCFGLKISLNQDAEVFLLREMQDGSFYRLLPEQSKSVNDRFKLFAGEVLRYPGKKLFFLSPEFSTENIHAIAVNNNRVAHKLHRLLHTMPVCCAHYNGSAIRNWYLQLQSLNNEKPDKMEWQIINLRQ